MRARGQPSRHMMDRECPHRGHRLAETAQGKNLGVTIIFHAKINQPHASSVGYQRQPMARDLLLCRPGTRQRVSGAVRW